MVLAVIALEYKCRPCLGAVQFVSAKVGSEKVLWSFSAGIRLIHRESMMQLTCDVMPMLELNWIRTYTSHVPTYCPCRSISATFRSNPSFSSIVSFLLLLLLFFEWLLACLLVLFFFLLSVDVSLRFHAHSMSPPLHSCIHLCIRSFIHSCIHFPFDCFFFFVFIHSFFFASLSLSLFLSFPLSAPSCPPPSPSPPLMCPCSVLFLFLSLFFLHCVFHFPRFPRSLFDSLHVNWSSSHLFFIFLVCLHVVLLFFVESLVEFVLIGVKNGRFLYVFLYL